MATSAAVADVAAQGPMLHHLGPLRFLAAAWVVWYHFGKGMVADADPWTMSLREHGYLGVPMFFLLSGYVLAHRYHAEHLSTAGDAWRFWVRRIARIYPVYLVSILLSSWYVAVHRGWTPYYTKVALLQASMLQSWRSAEACSMNCPAWSISVEVHLYVLFPFALAALVRWPRAFIGFLVSWAVLLVPIGLLHWQGVGDLGSRDLRFLPVMHAMSFCLGMLLRRHRAGLSRVPAGVYLAAGIAGLAFVVGAVGPGHPSTRVLLNNVGAVPASALLVLGAAHLPALPSGAWTRAMAGLGDLSYALYILQYSIQRLLVHYLPWTGQPGRSTLPGFLLFAAVLLVASWLSVRLIERPGKAWLVARLSTLRLPWPRRAPRPAPEQA